MIVVLYDYFEVILLVVLTYPIALRNRSFSADLKVLLLYLRANHRQQHTKLRLNAF